jgi:hypothetical protein
MREYESREAAENDPELDLQIIWKCNKCGEEREERPHWNEGGPCSCGGSIRKEPHDPK